MLSMMWYRLCEQQADERAAVFAARASFAASLAATLEVLSRFVAVSMQTGRGRPSKRNLPT